jgi:hypothetical protein
MMKWIVDKIEGFSQVIEKSYSFLFKWVLFAVALFAIYYILIITVLPVMHYTFSFPVQKSTSKSLKHDFSLYYTLNDSLIDRSKELANKEAYLLARMEMTRNDSINMALDLMDSTVSLIVQGVAIFTSKITSYESSNLFRKIDPFITDLYFSWPFKIKEYSSSIPKIPVLIKKAPRDTVEAASLPQPGQLEESHQYVSFQIKLDRKLGLTFEQDSISDLINRKSIRNFIHQQRKVKKKAIRNALIRAGPMEYVPEIKVKLNRQAALVIFRAIPENADIAIRLNPNH